MSAVSARAGAAPWSGEALQQQLERRLREEAARQLGAAARAAEARAEAAVGALRRDLDEQLRRMERRLATVETEIRAPPIPEREPALEQLEAPMRKLELAVQRALASVLPRVETLLAQLEGCSLVLAPRPTRCAPEGAVAAARQSSDGSGDAAAGGDTPAACPSAGRNAAVKQTTSVTWPGDGGTGAKETTSVTWSSAGGDTAAARSSGGGDTVPVQPAAECTAAARIASTAWSSADGDTAAARRSPGGTSAAKRSSGGETAAARLESTVCLSPAVEDTTAARPSAKGDSAVARTTSAARPSDGDWPAQGPSCVVGAASAARPSINEASISFAASITSAHPSPAGVVTDSPSHSSFGDASAKRLSSFGGATSASQPSYDAEDESVAHLYTVSATCLPPSHCSSTSSTRSSLSPLPSSADTPSSSTSFFTCSLVSSTESVSPPSARLPSSHVLENQNADDGRALVVARSAEDSSFPPTAGTLMDSATLSSAGSPSPSLSAACCSLLESYSTGASSEDFPLLANHVSVVHPLSVPHSNGNIRTSEEETTNCVDLSVPDVSPIASDADVFFPSQLHPSTSLVSSSSALSISARMSDSQSTLGVSASSPISTDHKSSLGKADALTLAGSVIAGSFPSIPHSSTLSALYSSAPSSVRQTNLLDPSVPRLLFVHSGDPSAKPQISSSSSSPRLSPTACDLGGSSTKPHSFTHSSSPSSPSACQMTLLELSECPAPTVRSGDPPAKLRPSSPPRVSPAEARALGKALVAAAKSGDAAAARRLLDAGADADFSGGALSRTPLMHAAEAARADVVALLLARGADPRLRCASDGLTALHRALAANRGGRCVRALLAAGADPDDDANPARRAPLHCAAEAGNEAAVRELLRAGADRRRPDAEGRTPEQVARGAAVRRLLQ